MLFVKVYDGNFVVFRSSEIIETFPPTVDGALELVAFLNHPDRKGEAFSTHNILEYADNIDDLSDFEDNAFNIAVQRFDAALSKGIVKVVKNVPRPTSRLCTACPSVVEFENDTVGTEAICPLCGEPNYIQEPAQWIGPQMTCDYCLEEGKSRDEADVRNHAYFVDGRTDNGPWALMCPYHYSKHGTIHLGEGSGQMYSGKTLLKLKG